VGATESVAIDVRIVAATNRDLETEVRAGRFREDLYYRFAVIEVMVPPLRDRPDDIPLLARHLLRKIARERGDPERKLAPEALARLVAYPWPGNVRELLNAIEHAATLGEETIEAKDLPARVQGGGSGEGGGGSAATGGGGAGHAGAGGAAGKKLPVSPSSVPNTNQTEQPPAASISAARGPEQLTLAELERRHVLGALAREGGDRRRAAEALGVNISTLYRMLKRWEGEAGTAPPH
jgi:DNA-binding NtrC family response regulator